ncbi:thioredoxin family protein [Muricauda sp. SCSIO 64092]|uniref:thioredoxin family protein n=1 Tax=Allomuricauda sp. SCSIO 64092 TaxID=2908842 RepID=UPI001FF45579|nr:thioredoxin family protein [Muricauda sp. SCSIO 64092]UOY05089.1 thioredoxin family protein [Muricauda sp. SCSIO 64092]
MKNLFFLMSIALVFQLKAQTAYQEIATPNGDPFLLGKISKANLKASPYQTWYKNNYEAYPVDENLVSLFKKELNQHEVVLFLGTWCGDSKREVPRMLKILETANFPEKQLKIVALDRRKDNYKKGPNGEEIGWNIKRVPTLILLKNGVETNRIVERPVDTLEEDLLAILTNLDYTPNYAN